VKHRPAFFEDATTDLAIENPLYVGDSECDIGQADRFPVQIAYRHPSLPAHVLDTRLITGSPLRDDTVSRLVEPFGFTKEEGVLGPEGDVDVLLALLVLGLDVLTLPLGVLWIAGSRQTENE